MKAINKSSSYYETVKKFKELELTEGRSTGIRKIKRVTAQNGSPEPTFETDEDRSYFIVRLPVHPDALSSKQVKEQVTDHVIDHVTDHVKSLILILDGNMSRPELMDILRLKHNQTFRENYLHPALKQEWIEMTLPDKPKSVNQKYRLTDKGKRLKDKLNGMF